ncbi:unnamed protein product [Didymodactylos carnosus]|uniref:Uncharacterized protein n=1 Tax=Didymodactylos carnosus TaxID=1234261 RepID=A0A815VUC2_9BILA|nr:unnamed protein product [Didymodactylos carnosus]CAF1534935.1 unnamed protein product [Didymodactylos carnosus]CAF4143843.1 unnamed protein product [Didymodactylos carnosus]CAF4394644.1 unnamed protein product [Didymodactylos carnosus]
MDPYICISKINGLSSLLGFFCGHQSYCGEVNSFRAFQQAKWNIEKYYTVVGLTEQFDEFLFVLQRLIPRYFRNVYQLYQTEGKPHLNKQPDGYAGRIPVPVTLNKLKFLLKYDYELYNFVKKRFYEQYMQLKHRICTSTVLCS